MLQRLALGCGATLALGPRAFGASSAPSDDALLDDLSKRCFLFFWEQSDSQTGITRDRTRGDGGHIAGSRADVGSTGATGFSLTALCIGAERGWVSRDEAKARVRATLKAYVDGPVVNEHGWFYHFVDVHTGQRAGTSEMSTSDSTWLVLGGLTCRAYFAEDAEINRLATTLYQRTHYRWMANTDPHLMAHGWRPEGFIKFRYDKYCQLAAMYLLAISNPVADHALPPESWYAWKRNPYTYGKYSFIGGTLLWTYRFPFAWFDLRNRREARDAQVNYWENSTVATRAHRQFCLDLRSRFPGYAEDLWGITSSITRHGYKAWGGPPLKGPVDGSIVPCAAAGSLMFTPDLSLAALHAMKGKYGDKIYRRYGFTDAFHPTDGWVTDDVIGIDIGITLLAAENHRTGNVWRWFMSNPEPRRALDLAELHSA